MTIPTSRYVFMLSSLLVILSIVSVVGLPMFMIHVPRGFGISAQWALPVILICCLPFVIRGYIITADAILVQRLFWKTRLDRARLKSATVVPKAMSKSVRACGNGGGFSFTGWYWSPSLGFYRVFVTDLNRTVVLRFEKRTVVVSPGEPEDFVEELTR